MDPNTEKDIAGAFSQRGNNAINKDSARGNQSKPSKKKGPPPAFAYHPVGR